MLFSIKIGGSQTEGPEANTRFDKITADYVDSLRSAGFLVDSVDGRPDSDKPASEVLTRKGKNIGLTTEPEPASWQAAVMSAAARQPAAQEASTVETLNANLVSKAEERIGNAKIATTKAGDTKAEDGSEAEETTEAAAPTDAELVANDDPKLALKPDKQTAPQVNSFLKANDYTEAELNAALATEKAGRNRPAVVSALEAARAARVAAIA